MSNSSAEQPATEPTWHAVVPKRNCPHVRRHVRIRDIPAHVVTDPCADCASAEENWMCLHCGFVGCSRYQGSHTSQHCLATSHAIAASFSDLSFWCYQCDSYISHRSLKPVFEQLHVLKFGRGSCENALVEREDDEETILDAARQVAQMLRESSQTVFFTGAGISTSCGIGDFRGPNGLWTKKDQEAASELGFEINSAACRSNASGRGKVNMSSATPSVCHFAISDLVERNMCQFVVSTNADCLHLKSGLPEEKLAELHGNIYKEICTGTCKKTFFRDVPVRQLPMTSPDDPAHVRRVRSLQKRTRRHYRGRQCEECGGDLWTSSVQFGEGLPKEPLDASLRHSETATLSIVLGTSMRVQPACSFPLYAKKNPGGKLVIVNLQATPYDADADIRVFGRTDVFMRMVMQELDSNQEQE